MLCVHAWAWDLVIISSSYSYADCTVKHIYVLTPACICKHTLTQFVHGGY